MVKTLSLSVSCPAGKQRGSSEVQNNQESLFYDWDNHLQKNGASRSKHKVSRVDMTKKKKQNTYSEAS